MRIDSAKHAVAALMLLMVVACSKNDPGVELVPPSQYSIPGSEGTLADDYADSLNVDLANDRIKSVSGSQVDGVLSNAGNGGYLLFGPYTAFKAGDYMVRFEGTVTSLPTDSTVRLDAVSGAGKVAHGALEVRSAGELPPFEFSLPEPVSDLEIRVLAPAGSHVSLRSYQVTRRL